MLRQAQHARIFLRYFKSFSARSINSGQALSIVEGLREFLTVLSKHLLPTYETPSSPRTPAD
jgi:hypothetical protein